MNQFYRQGIPIFVEERRVFPIPTMSWQRETVMVRGKGQARHRDLKTGRFIRKP